MTETDGTRTSARARHISLHALCLVRLVCSEVTSWFFVLGAPVPAVLRATKGGSDPVGDRRCGQADHKSKTELTLVTLIHDFRHWTHPASAMFRDPS